jgi:type II restriction/modification system DNA methylase subunit YeeA
VFQLESQLKEQQLSQGKVAEERENVIKEKSAHIETLNSVIQEKDANYLLLQEEMKALREVKTKLDQDVQRLKYLLKVGLEEDLLTWLRS